MFRHFYHQLTKKYVVLFGNMFNNITLVRYNRDDNSELERIKVPIIFGPKERYITRIQQDTNLTKETQITLPRMSFFISSYGYDAGRKQETLLKSVKTLNSTQMKSQYMGVPYDFNFDLDIYARNIDDGTQIIEQILPYFTPDYTVTATLIPEINMIKDIPIILTSVSENIEYEGSSENTRYVNWSLGFTLKGYYFGPIIPTGIIRKAITNIYNDPNLVRGYITKINTDIGNNGDYKLEDVVYQGDNYNTATAFGQVIKWDRPNQILHLGGVQGNFQVNTSIRGVSTNANYSIVSFDASPLKLAQITIEPDPIDAEPDDNYGYSTQILEHPETL